MVGRLVRLKLRLLVNGLKSDPQRRFGLPLAVVGVAFGGYWAASAFARSLEVLTPQAAGEYSIWVVSIGWALWVVMPVVFFPLDEPLDPLKLALLPWSRGRLMTGLAGSSLVAIPVIVPFLVLAVDVGHFATLGSLPIVATSAAVLLLMLVTGGQALSNLVSLALRSRRGRDLAFVVVAGIGLGLYAMFEGITGHVSSHGLEGAVLASPLSPWAQLFPPAAAQHAIVQAGRGNIGQGMTTLIVALMWLGVLTLAWSSVMDRLVTRPTSSSLPARSAGKRRRQVHVHRARSAVSRKEILIHLRDPRLRAVWTGGAIFVGLLIASLLLGATRLEVFHHLPWLTMAGPVVVLFIGLPVTLNQLGWERNSVSFMLALPMRPLAVLAGKNQAVATVLLVEGLGMSVVLAAVSGGWRWLPFAVPIAVTAVACQLAVGNVVSVVAPLRLPPLGTDLFGQATEQGCLSIFSQAVAFFVIGLLLMPSAVAYIVVAAGLADAWLISLGSVLWGGLLYWLGLVAAAKLMTRRIPELVAAVEAQI